MRLGARQNDNVPDWQAFEKTLLAVEQAHIHGGSPEDSRLQTWGLALSGGGIRSATFCLGVIQALAKRGLLGAFDYCSTVSGGGYIGGYLQAMLHRRGLAETLEKLAPTHRTHAGKGAGCSATTDSVRDLRRYSNFLSPNKAALSSDRIALVSAYVSNMLLTIAQLGCLIICASFIPLFVIQALWVASNSAPAIVAIAILCAGTALLVRRRSKYEGANATPAAASTNSTFRGLPPALLAVTFVLLAVVLWAPRKNLGSKDAIVATMHSISAFLGIEALSENPQYTFNILALGLTYLLAFIAWLVCWLPSARKNHADTLGRRVARQLLCAPVAAVVLGVSGASIAAGTADSIGFNPYIAVAFGTPALFALFYVVNNIHLSFAYGPGDGTSRERWTRLTGKTALWIVFGVTIPVALTLLIPAAILQSQVNRSALIAGLGSAWALACAVGPFLAYKERTSTVFHGVKRVLTRLAVWVALWSLIGGIVLASGLLVLRITACYSTDALTCIAGQAHLGAAAIAMVLAGATWYLFALLVDENEFSMNGFYRNRLVRCYLAPSRDPASRDEETGLDPEGDDIALSDLLKPLTAQPDNTRPLYPLLCGAINIRRSSRLEWQDRMAASFVFSPIYCGHLPTSAACHAVGDITDSPLIAGNAVAVSESLLAKEHTLGAAMSVSGAAVNPSMGYRSSTAASVLLTLFNARLGWWIKNYNAPATSIYFAGLNLLSELLSYTRETSRYVNVSDGGHFENLGIYELVRRRCRFIVAVDASADRGRSFRDLASAIRACRIDFGAEISLDTSLLRCDSVTGKSMSCYAVGDLVYLNGERGTIVYVKPSLIGSESADVTHYAIDHRCFPHEPTHDQFFDEAQFECYRQLGFEAGLRTFDLETPSAPSSIHPIPVNDHEAKESFVQELAYKLRAPAALVKPNSSKLNDRLAALLGKQRGNPRLAWLDEQIYPGLRGLPVQSDFGGSDFRDAFYFIQEVIQLMEAVYVDLDLEHTWAHPENQGWMNQFRHWIWVPLFRLVWSITVQTRNHRFVRFCEERLRMPRLHNFMEVQSHPLTGAQYASEVRALLGAAKINALEASLLDSQAIVEQVRSAGAATAVTLEFVRDRFLDDVLLKKAMLGEMASGVALVAHIGDNKNALVALRVRNHLRHLGIGRAFAGHLIRLWPNVEPRISEGIYEAGMRTVDAQAADRQNAMLTRLLDQARNQRPLRRPTNLAS